MHNLAIFNFLYKIMFSKKEIRTEDDAVVCKWLAGKGGCRIHSCIQVNTTWKRHRMQETKLFSFFTASFIQVKESRKGCSGSSLGDYSTSSNNIVDFKQSDEAA